MKNKFWSSDCKFEDWEQSLREEYPEATEEELYGIMYRRNDDYLEDERNRNLKDIIFENGILIIADLGFWNGRTMGYKQIPSGKLCECLCYQYIGAEWWVDENGDLRGTEWHHDNTNHYLYREWKPNITEPQKASLLKSIYDGNPTDEQIRRATRRIGDPIAAVYGWKLSGRPVKRKEK